MPTVNVDTVEQANSLLQFIAHRLHDMRGVWDRMELRLPAEQRRWWDRRFGRTFIHHPKTVKARAKRRGYYKKHKPSSRASASAPYFEWTGSLREATEKFSRKDTLRASLDANQTYKGPLKTDKPFDLTLGRRNVEGWDKKRLNKVLTKSLEDWLEDMVKEVRI